MHSLTFSKAVQWARFQSSLGRFWSPDLMFDSPNENYGPRILGETLREKWLIKISFRELFKANHWFSAEEGCSRVWALQPQYMITSDCKVRAWYSQEILIRWSEWSAVVSLDLLQMHSVTTKHSDMFEFWFESWRNAVNFDFVLLLLPTFTGEFPGVSLLSVWKKQCLAGAVPWLTV